MSSFYRENLQSIAEENGFQIAYKGEDFTGCGFNCDILLDEKNLGGIKVWFQVGRRLTPKSTEISFLVSKETEISKKEVFKDLYIDYFDGVDEYKDALNKLFEELK
jgi:hypothetical protein